jgi:DNA polymerase-3 subunit delta'
VIVIEQVRDLMQVVHLKPTEAEYKVAVIAGADRLNVQAANAFLKTLEEPPPKSVLILLTTDPQRVLETILSRCMRLGFGSGKTPNLRPEDLEWLRDFSDAAGAPHKSLLSRYRLLDVLLQRLQQLREKVEENLSARSPLTQHPEAERDLRDKWEVELAAAVESEYRRERADLLLMLQWWFRDVWLHAAGLKRTEDLAALPTLNGTRELARRITSEQALENLRQMEETQRLLFSNVQEALALEVGLLKLNL